MIAGKIREKIREKVKKKLEIGIPILKKRHKRNIKILITCIAVVLFWRGIWGLADIYLFPEKEILSYIASVIIGIFILYVDDGMIKELE